MDEPYWRVKSFHPGAKQQKVSSNGNVNNGFNDNALNNSQK
jgi:hypothetical protein